MTTAVRKSLEPWIFDTVEYYPHQIEGIRTLASWRSFILADDMGLGKSLQALTVFTIDVVREWAQTAIVVCPATLKGNWADEIDKFTRFPFVILDGIPAQRTIQLKEFANISGPKILIVNYEQVTKHLSELESFNFDIAIFDEAQYLQNPKAKRTKACLSLYSRRSFMLTGTPMKNHVNNLWTLLHRVDPTGFPKYWSFVNRYCVFGGWESKQIVGTKNEAELRRRVQNIMLRRLKKDVLDLPDIQIFERRVDLLPEQQKLYNSVYEEMKLPTVDSSSPSDIENALTKFLRLKQICGTTAPFTNEDYSAKLDLATQDDLVLLGNENKVVVFTQFRSVLACYQDRMTKLAPHIPIYQLHGNVPIKDRKDIVKRWSDDPKPGVLACMLQVAGVGLNMVAAQHASFLDKLFTPADNQQAIDRLHRIGQSNTQPVQVREYICRKTIESRVNQILRIKDKVFKDIIESDPNWKTKLYTALLEAEDDLD